MNAACGRQQAPLAALVLCLASRTYIAFKADGNKPFLPKRNRDASCFTHDGRANEQVPYMRRSLHQMTAGERSELLTLTKQIDAELQTPPPPIVSSHHGRGIK